ncbi:hypothetical protein [Cellulosilyticum ruminicola]|uniref:hypothetical protein n=1 Tax=Cellulosilyticum ruminicola TaxID=425254 RepID=UPI0006D1C230|nr:hypothetical protein [Cellulosilyticum ruminicola]
MKLAKKLLIGTLIISMVVLGGCGKKKEAPAETTATVTEIVKPSESPEATSEESPKAEEENKEENKNEKDNAEVTDTTQDTSDSDEVPIDKAEYANLKEIEGKSYRTRIPEGWSEGGDAKINSSVAGYTLISNSKLNSQIAITEQALDGADTIDMAAYMKDHKEMYNKKSESTGVYVQAAGAKELDAVKIGFMKCNIKITEQMVKNAITVGSITQDEVDAAGGMDAYIKEQNTTQLQIYVPNKNCMITIATKLEGDSAEAVEKAAYDLANIMYLK